MVRTSSGGVYTKAEVIEYHILKGLEKKQFQMDKIRQLKELGFKVSYAGLVSYPNGDPLLKPKYVWIKFDMQKFLLKHIGSHRFYKWLNVFYKLNSKLIYELVVKVFCFDFAKRIDTTEQVNIFKDWDLKFLIIPHEKNTNDIWFQYFTNYVEFVSWETHNKVMSFDFSLADEFYSNTDLLLPNKYFFRYKE